MVKASQSTAPFLTKCYEMVDDEVTDSIISWSQYNGSFIIWDMTEFTGHLLPKYFKHSNFSSFIRQLNIYELVKLRQYQEIADNKLLRLKDHLQGMEISQQQLLSFLQPKANNQRMAEASNMLSNCRG
ncbi:hypothetical protein PVK06_017128 [Gossypium arboreum]|uniref:HSF-type DNA-binding domain-containing protein n=1 Tax=Gossypium arboreum TaxID=29729 RepID=A0ABR0Q239_GOSAR|nr:hypothetical protein PVK06_017128 [Gossypium arboreum]